MIQARKIYLGNKEFKSHEKQSLVLPERNYRKNENAWHPSIILVTKETFKEGGEQGDEAFSDFLTCSFSFYKVCLHLLLICCESVTKKTKFLSLIITTFYSLLGFIQFL